MAVAKAYLEGSDVEANPSSGAVRLTVKLPPGTIDAEGPRTPQVNDRMKNSAGEISPENRTPGQHLQRCHGRLPVQVGV